MAYLYDLTDTWNAAGTVFNAIRMNVTNSASAVGSKIVSLQVGSTDRFTVDKDGNGYLSGTLQVVGSVSSPNVYISGNSGTIGMQDNTASILAYNGTGSGGITNALRFITAASERVRIDTSGNVGIGTSSPAGRLDVVSTSAGGASFMRVANGSGAANSYAAISLDPGNNGFNTRDAQIRAINNGSNQISLTFLTSNAGTPFEAMRIDPSGNVGIGTTTTTRRLEVVGPTITTATPSTYAVGIANTGGANGDITLGSDASYGYIQSWSKPLYLNKEGNNVLFGSGNVGIGLTNPTFKLQVNGTFWTASNVQFYDQDGFRFSSASAISAMRFGSAYTGESTAEWAYNRATAITSLSVGNTGSALNERLRVDASGNVAIGTSTTVARFRVAAGGVVNAPALGNVANYPAFFSNSDTGYGLGIGTNSVDGHVWLQAQRSDSAVAYNLTMQEAGGNVGIGTSSPGSNTRLNVAGRGLFTSGGFDPSDGTASGVSISYDTGNNVGTIGAVQTGVSERELRMRGNTLTFFTNGANERMRIDSSGSVVIGATSAAGARFNVTTAGAEDVIYVDANTAGAAGTAVYVLPIRTAATFRGGVRWNGTSVEYNTTSDIRLKENITDADDASALIDAIQVRKFDWKETGFHQRYGFVAQELVEVAPEAVSASSDPEEMMGVDYSKLVPMLVKELQSLRARVAQLEGN